MTLSKKK